MRAIPTVRVARMAGSYSARGGQPMHAIPTVRVARMAGSYGARLQRMRDEHALAARSTLLARAC